MPKSYGIRRLAGCLALAVNPAWGDGCRMEVIAGSLVTKTIFSRELSEWEAEPDPKGNGF